MACVKLKFRSLVRRDQHLHGASVLVDDVSQSYKVGFEILTAVSMKIAVIRHRPDDGGSKDL
jgi:hypothetical protein